jgi:hypothetical protein
MMNSRPITAAFFVIFCLVLCGLILRRQIAAHPLPPDQGQRGDSRGFGGGSQDFWAEFQGGHPADPSSAKQVRDLVQEEMTALRTGDAPKALSYQSRFLRQRLADPNEFMQFLLGRHPEMVYFRQVQCTSVLTDKEGQHAVAVVLIEGSKGDRTRGQFLLVRESGQFKIAGIRTQALPN